MTTRGWYRVEPGKCLNPDVTGQPRQLYSFAEAVDRENRAQMPGQAAELGRADGALHPREQFEIGAGRLRHPQACADRLRAGRHDRHGKPGRDGAAVREISSNFFPRPAKRGEGGEVRSTEPGEGHLRKSGKAPHPTLATLGSPSYPEWPEREQDAPPPPRMTAIIVLTSPRPFTHVDTWVFDLDKTSYPHHFNFWQQVDERIRAFIASS